MNMTTQREAFEKMCLHILSHDTRSKPDILERHTQADYRIGTYKNETVQYMYLMFKALSQPNEPVGYMTTASLGNLRSGHDVIVGKKLREPDRSVKVFTSPPNTLELEIRNTDLVAGVKNWQEIASKSDARNAKLEVSLDESRKNYIKACKGRMDFRNSFREGKAKIAELTAKLDKMREALNTTDVMLTLLREGDKGKQMDYVSSRHNSMVAVSEQHKIVKQALEGV